MGTAATAASQIHIAYLEPQEVREPLITCSLAASSQTTAFRKEPDLGQRKVSRGKLELGGAPGAAIPFIWDRAQAKLYLDLNRNLDLTDDADGVFTSPRKGFSQSFTNVHLVFDTASGTRRVLVDIDLADYGILKLIGSLGSRSFWQGKINLQGQDWQVGVIENPAGPFRHSHLLLRPWQNRAERFSLMDGSLDAFAFPTNLFFLNRAYQVTCDARPQGDPPKLRLQFRELPARLGGLKLAGAFLQRVILEAGDYTVVLDSPPPLVKVPVGTYGQPRAWLKRGDAQACRSPGGLVTTSRIAITENQTVDLTLGGPLTNSVAISRRTKQLVFNYQLLGADGVPYQLTSGDRSKPPEFIVFQGEKKIASGSFEFG